MVFGAFAAAGNYYSPFKQRDKANITAHFDRTVTNVGDPNSVYKVTVTVPGGTSVSVKRNRLAFKSVGEKLSFHERVEAASWKIEYCEEWFYSLVRCEDANMRIE
ncbi:hypothetical protein LIER_04484 [Lithospermum erythrorhizon]|uniref:Subtilisin-like protease fibronectin type-III domain-containing protein n=1 Tax=Lithospermum erythrorhizon TaxID=34254 RepID=A0AAV3NXS0_LITER